MHRIGCLIEPAALLKPGEAPVGPDLEEFCCPDLQAATNRLRVLIGSKRRTN